MTSIALVPLASGVEEIEFVTVVDTLRRAGVEVTVAGLGKGEVTASRGIRLVPDVPLDEISSGRDYDLVVIPGGLAGAEACAVDPRVIERLVHCHAMGRPVAAICAGPLALHAAGLLQGRRFTCHPSVRDRFEELVPTFEERVVIDDGVVTSQGPGTALEFSLALVGLLVSEKKVAELSRAMMVS